MPKNKHSNNSFRRRPFYKRPMFWLLLLALIFAAILVSNYLKLPDSPTKTDTSSTVDKEEDNRSDKSKDDNLPKESTEPKTESSETTTSPDGKTPSQYDGDNPNLNNTLTGAISTARFSGENLIIRVNIDQFVTGSCNLTLSDGARKLEKTARLITSASTSTCEGFDVQGSEITDFSRPINIIINLSSGDKTGTITGSIN